MMELNGEDVRIGLSPDTMERRALTLIGRVTNDYYTYSMGKAVYGLPGVCERSTLPLPYGCWADDRSPYAMYGDDRWCDACIAYAALHGTLPRPELTIDGELPLARIAP